MVAVKDPAEAIKARLKTLGISQASFSTKVGKSPSWAATRFLPNVENAIRYLAYKEPATLDRILATLRWTPEEFAEATGLEVPSIYTQPKRGGDAKPVSPDEIELVPVIGSASGGRPWPTVEHIPITKRWLRPGTIVFRVEGDSMDNGEEGGIRDGDYVLVDQNLKEFREGKVFLVEIVGDGLTIKRARRTKNGWVLVSDNPKGPILTPDEAKIVGEVYRVISIREV